MLCILTHPVLGLTCDLVGMAYELCASKDPEIRDLYVTAHPETGEEISRYYITARIKEDLASDDAGYITGHALPVDGGISGSLSLPGRKI